MNKFLLSIVLISLSHFLGAQNLQQVNQDRIDRTKKGMLVLGSWAAANMIVSPVLRNNDSGAEKYFHEMNGYWNIVNFVIAGAGYISLRKQDPQAFNLRQTLEEQQKIEKLLLFNAGLDLGYIAAGAYLNEKGKNDNDSRIEGYGESLMLQGAFLAAFDLVFYIAQRKGSKSVYNLLSSVQISPYGARLTFKF